MASDIKGRISLVLLSTMRFSIGMSVSMDQLCGSYTALIVGLIIKNIIIMLDFVVFLP